MNPTIEKLDNELIFDIEHIILNYYKMNNFNSDCLKGTNIQIGQNIISYINDLEFSSNSNKFASNYFLELSKKEKENLIDLFSPLISNFPNSDFALFLSVLLKKHLIDISDDLNLSENLFHKYKNEIFKIYHNVLPKQKKNKLLENICASITVLIIVGLTGEWTNGIDQLCIAAKENNGGNTENILITAQILSNIDNIFSKLDNQLENQKSKLLLSLLDSYSDVVISYIRFLISNQFSGEKQNFVNGDLFKAFIGILLCSKYFKLNIIKIQGLMEFLINCIYYIDNNQDFIVQICEVFDITFNIRDKNLKYNYIKHFKTQEFATFIKQIPKNEDFQEIIKCIKLIENMKNFYSNKNLNEIINNPKDIQILFASCNIFNSICENYGYIFVIPELDTTVQDIFSFFLNMPIPKINIILLSSFDDLCSLSQTCYKFENYDNNVRENKMIRLNNFIYSAQNTVMQYMKLSDEELNSFNVDKNEKILSYSLSIKKYIDKTLKMNINTDEKKDLIENADEFYNNIFDIIFYFFNFKDYCNKLLEFFKNSTKNNDLSTIESLFNVFNNLTIRITNNDYSDTYYNLIEHIFQNKEILFTNKRIVLQFLKLLYNLFINISKEPKYLYLVIDNLINDSTIKNLNCEKINQIIIILINKLILTSYQSYLLEKENDNADTSNQIDVESKNNYLNNIFNALSKLLLDKLHTLDHFYLYKIIDAFYHSLFLNIALNIINKDSIYTASEKLLNDANQIYAKGNNNDSIIKYIFIVRSIILDVRKENKGTLFNLMNNKNDPFYNPPQSYLSNIQKNIINIIKTNSNANFNINLMNGVILLCEAIITGFKEKIVNLFDYFNQIISMIISINAKYIDVYSLTYSLYNQIFTYNQNSEKYNIISQIGFDILNSINNLYNQVYKNDETINLANRQLEFLILYIQKSPYFINNLNKEIFIQSISNIINIFDKSNQINLSINFMNFFKILFDLSINNNVFENILKNNFIEKLITTIIFHIQYFNAQYIKCRQNCIDIFKDCVGGGMEEKFRNTLNQIYNDNELIDVIVNYMNFLKNTKMSKYTMDQKIRDFISDLSGLYYAMKKRRKEFIFKYTEELQNDVEKLKNIPHIVENMKVYDEFNAK